jgi:hypothetical protein
LALQSRDVRLVIFTNKQFALLQILHPLPRHITGLAPRAEIKLAIVVGVGHFSHNGGERELEPGGRVVTAPGESRRPVSKS